MYFEPKILNIHYWVWDSSVGGYEFRCEATCTASDLLPLLSLHRPAITCDLSVWTWNPMKCCIICKFFGCSPLTMQSYEVSSPQVVHRGTVPTAVIRYDLRVYNMVYTQLVVRYPFLVFITFIQNRWSRMYSRVFDVVITLLVFLGLLQRCWPTWQWARAYFSPILHFPSSVNRSHSGTATATTATAAATATATGRATTTTASATAAETDLAVGSASGERYNPANHLRCSFSREGFELRVLPSK